jgi:hypothetical protein
MAEYDRCHRPFYPKAGNGRRPYPLETMLRILPSALVQQATGAMEGALYEIASMRLFTFDYPWMALRTGSHIS